MITPELRAFIKKEIVAAVGDLTSQFAGFYEEEMESTVEALVNRIVLAVDREASE